jgi:hypothetical protein
MYSRTGLVGFLFQGPKKFGGTTPGNPSLATSSNRKQDQGNGQGHRSPESASELLWVTAQRHMEIDAAFCIWFCNRLVSLFVQNTSFSETKVLF